MEVVVEGDELTLIPRNCTDPESGNFTNVPTSFNTEIDYLRDNVIISGNVLLATNLSVKLLIIFLFFFF